MNIPIGTLTVIVCALANGFLAAGQIPYSAVEVDRFVSSRGVAFPAEYQSALVEDIAREISVAFPTVLIVRQGEPAPAGHALLLISGLITEFKPGNRAKRYLIGFGAGATVVKAQIWFTDNATSQIILNRESAGATGMGAVEPGVARMGSAGTGASGADYHGAAESLARKIAKLCNAAHLIASN